MKRYDFDEIVPRRGTFSVKWDTPEEEGVVPMWVADMDFRTAPAVREALRRRVEHGVYGYARVPEAFREAMAAWFAGRHGWPLDPAWIRCTPGVVPALGAIIRALTRPGDRVIVQTPAYNSFYGPIRSSGCELSANRLRCGRGRCEIDFGDLEARAADPKARLLLLSNPHNPVGRVWSEEELRRMGEIALRHGLYVLADEIHCELTFGGHEYRPFASLDAALARRTVTCLSPSKAFNLAGLQIAAVVTPDEELRRRVDRSVEELAVGEVGPFGLDAAIAAYREGGEWLDELTAYLWENYLLVIRFFEERLPQFGVLPLEGSYLVWIDCRAAGEPDGELARRLEREQRVKLNPGSMYGPGGEGFLRLNIACPRALLEEGLARLERGLKGRNPAKDHSK